MPPFQSGVGVLKPKGLVNEKNGSIFSWKVQVPIDTYLADFPFTPRKRVGKPSSLVLLRDLYKPSLYIFTLFGQDPKFVHIYLAFETVARITATFKIFAIICICVIICDFDRFWMIYSIWIGVYAALLKFVHFGKALVGGPSRISLEYPPIIPNNAHGRGIRERGCGLM